MQRVVCTGPAVPVAYAWKDTADPTWRTSGRPVTGRRRALNPVKKFLIGLAVVLSAVVTVVLVGPGFIDWNAYRAPVARQISALPGRTVTIGGEGAFALLPPANLSARELRGRRA